MFNKTIIQSETKVCPVTQVVEKTISPDKVVEMYDKTLDSVEKKILSTFRVESNYLKGVVVMVEEDYSTAQKILLLRFNLNGKSYEDKVIVGIEEVDTNEKTIQFMVDFYTRTLAKEFMKQTIGLVLDKKFTPHQLTYKQDEEQRNKET